MNFRTQGCIFPLILAIWTGFCSSLTAQNVHFNRDIRPILADHCFACHGPDSATRMADLRLDLRESALEMGAIVPGEPEESELIARVNTRDPDLAMPPREFHKPLTKQQRDLLKTWINEGANYDEHWAWVPPVAAEPPSVTGHLVRNPIDAFVVDRLLAQGLVPNAEASLPELLRRVTLDLTGLPPDPVRIQAVLTDTAPDRYERYVDWLLKQPTWGEHRARYWLDYARYADTHGIHFDNFREMWAYRDWLIDAFNRNLPFDQFTIEQLAGDLLPEPTLDQRVATGFNRCNITTNEGGVIEEEYRVLYARDRVETTMLVWNGLTMGCAVCHDHKYDPFTQRDFYQLAAFFNHTTQPVMDGNVRDTPPIVVVPPAAERSRYAAIVQEIAECDRLQRQLRNAQQDEFNDLIENGGQPIADWRASVSIDWPAAHFEAPLSDGSGTEVSVIVDGEERRVPSNELGRWTTGFISEHAWQIAGEGQLTFADVGDFERDQAFTVSFWFKPGVQDGAIVARMNETREYQGWDIWLQGGFVGMHVIHRWPQNALKVVATERPLQKDRWHYVVVSYDGTSTPEGIAILIDGQPVAMRVEQNALRDSVRTDVPFRIGARHRSSVTAGSAISDLRILPGVPTANWLAGLATGQRANYLLGRDPSELTAAERDELFDGYLRQFVPAYREHEKRAVDLREERAKIEQRGTMAHVMHEREDGQAAAFMLVRGEYDRRGDQVFPATPDSLPPLRDEYPRNRLGLARWLLDEAHPLTARVTVNRFWQEVFGRGLVASSGDFGVMGELPSHPELLDYLAVRFRQEGWDVKALFRLMVTSATYRQSAAANAEQWAADPENVLLGRGPRFRMDAEMIRDAVLASSGVLVRHIGGPSVRPYQPAGVWEAVAMPESNTRSYQMDDGEALYRRSMYTFWKRAAPPASMDVFNAPNREVCTIRRERTNTPLQALAMLNDVQVIEAGRLMAEGIVRELRDEQVSDSAAIDDLGWRLLGRPWADEERAIVSAALATLREKFRGEDQAADQVRRIGRRAPDETLNAVEVAAWTMVVNVLMNLDEFLNK